MNLNSDYVILAILFFVTLVGIMGYVIFWLFLWIDNRINL